MGLGVRAKRRRRLTRRSQDLKLQRGGILEAQGELKASWGRGRKCNRGAGGLDRGGHGHFGIKSNNTWGCARGGAPKGGQSQDRERHRKLHSSQEAGGEPRRGGSHVPTPRSPGGLHQTPWTVLPCSGWPQRAQREARRPCSARSTRPAARPALPTGPGARRGRTAPLDSTLRCSLPPNPAAMTSSSPFVILQPGLASCPHSLCGRRV